MNPIEHLAERIASGTVVEEVDDCTLVMRDCEAGCDWTGTSGPGDSGTASRSDFDRPFPAGEVTRLVAATALLRACDLSLLGLDKSIANYLPEDLVQRVHIVDGGPTGGDVNIRHLVDSTSSGLRVAGRTYADAGAVLAGMILEEATGIPLADVYREFVLERAGMTATWLEVNPAEPQDGTLMTTASDLAALLKSLTDGSLLTQDAWAEMTAWQDSPECGYDEYGLGLGRYRIGGHEAIGHQGIGGGFAFWLPFDVVISGTVNPGRRDLRPLLDATFAALCTA